ncbi:hypothetical protein B0H15DRAFT_843175 [Mycena belliarum]|uniref:Uncharacterized protein n=1 Tax=Mycena belliarum TaxID=1033014 RepID=A0AAD6U673_9AGAR|nr:hypothetical protein B0H15DRAFT_843175 [Mycena belliae]
MSFTNINDPAGVKALLDQLRASQTWQSLVTAQAQAQEQPSPALPGAETPAGGPSVAALLSQLNARPAEPPRNAPPVKAPEVAADATPSPPPPAPYAITQDVRSLTFQQALPRLAQLSENPAVVSTIEQLRQEQNKVERELWQERTAIRTKYEEKVKVAKTRANLVGTTLSKHEVEMLSQAYEKDLRRFDAERVLPAWDGLVTSQQAALAKLRVPTMFPTAVKNDRERQQRVIQVLEGIVGPGGA